jgi:hypothetical protein
MDQNYVFVFNAEEMREHFSSWPEDVQVAVVRRFGDDSEFHLFHAKEEHGALMRIAQGLPVFPKVLDLPTCRVTFSEESAVVAAIGRQRDLVGEANDYKINFEFELAHPRQAEPDEQGRLEPTLDIPMVITSESRPEPEVVVANIVAAFDDIVEDTAAESGNHAQPLPVPPEPTEADAAVEEPVEAQPVMVYPVGFAPLGLEMAVGVKAFIADLDTPEESLHVSVGMGLLKTLGLSQGAEIAVGSDGTGLRLSFRVAEGGDAEVSGFGVHGADIVLPARRVSASIRRRLRHSSPLLSEVRDGILVVDFSALPEPMQKPVPVWRKPALLVAAGVLLAIVAVQGVVLLSILPKLHDVERAVTERPQSVSMDEGYLHNLRDQIFADEKPKKP